jgi:polar amino acid transport system substrate-binding protein
MKKCTVFFLAALLISISGIAGTDIIISLPEMPALIDEFNKLIIEMQKEYRDGKFIVIGKFPFARSVNNIITGKADVHMPLLFNDIAKRNIKDYIFSTESLTVAPFVLYANKNVKGLNARTVRKFKMCTDRGHVQYFDFEITPVDSIESALKMVDRGRMDGYFFSMASTDPVLKRSGLKNIKRVFYQDFQIKMILPNKERGRQIDKIVSGIIRILKRRGVCRKLLGPAEYTDWQI